MTSIATRSYRVTNWHMSYTVYSQSVEYTFGHLIICVCLRVFAALNMHHFSLFCIRALTGRTLMFGSLTIISCSRGTVMMAPQFYHDRIYSFLVQTLERVFFYYYWFDAFYYYYFRKSNLNNFAIIKFA